MTMPIFSRRKCIENIYQIAKEKGIAIKEVENSAGLSTGYLSRLMKDTIKAFPSGETFYLISECLGVSVDLLLMANYQSLNSMDLYVLRFIDRLLKESEEGKTNSFKWNKESVYTLKNLTTYEAEMHPLFAVYEVDGPDVFTSEKQIEYNSLFNEKGGCEIAGNFYKTKLVDTDAEVYLTRVDYYDPDVMGATEEYELYLLNDSKVKKVCTSNMAHAEIRSHLKALYDRIEEIHTHVVIDDDVKNIIDIFMSR